MNNQSASSATATVASPTQLVEAYVAAWNARDGAAVVAALAPGGTYVDPGLPEPVSGDALVGYITTLATAIPDFAFTTESFECGQHVMLHWIMTGTYTAPMPGLPEPTGAWFTLHGLDMIEIGADGIVSVDNYFDQLNWLLQLGIDVSLSVREPAPGTDSKVEQREL